MVTGVFPLHWVLDHACTDHVQVDVDQALDKMVVGRHGGGEVAVFPKSTFPGFALVVFLGDPPGCQLEAFADGAWFAILHQEVDMVASDDVVENGQPIPLMCLEQPVSPTDSVTPEFQQEVPVMTTMGQVPYTTRNVDAFGSWHRCYSKGHFALQMSALRSEIAVAWRKRSYKSID